MNKSFFLTTVLLFLFLSAANLNAQFYFSTQDPIINPSYSFYNSNFTGSVSSGMGYAGIANLGDISNSMLNPATLELKKKFQGEFSYTYKTAQKLQPALINPGDQFLRPTLFAFSLGFAYRVNDHFQAGFMYDNPQGFKYDMGTITMTNELGNPVGTYDAYNKLTVHSFSLPFVYSSERIRLGFRLNYSMYRNTVNTAITPGNVQIVTGKFNKFNAQFGIMVLPCKNLSIGMTVIPQVKGNADYNYPNPPILPVSNTVAIPQEIGGGIAYTFRGDFLKLLLDFKNIKTSVVENLKDINEIHMGLEYMHNEKWTFRMGFFNIPDVTDITTFYGGGGEKLEQVFLTAGATYKVKDFDINVNVLDSHISGGTIKNTYINAGFTYNVNKIPFLKKKM